MSKFLFRLYFYYWEKAIHNGFSTSYICSVPAKLGRFGERANCLWARRGTGDREKSFFFVRRPPQNLQGTARRRRTAAVATSAASGPPELCPICLRNQATCPGKQALQSFSEQRRGHQSTANGCKEMHKHQVLLLCICCVSHLLFKTKQNAAVAAVFLLHLHSEIRIPAQIYVPIVLCAKVLPQLDILSFVKFWKLWAVELSHCVLRSEQHILESALSAADRILSPHAFFSVYYTFP